MFKEIDQLGKNNLWINGKKVEIQNVLLHLTIKLRQELFALVCGWDTTWARTSELW